MDLLAGHERLLLQGVEGQLSTPRSSPPTGCSATTPSASRRSRSTTPSTACRTRECSPRWAGEVPDHFAFTLKAPRRITHDKRLKEVGEDVAEFLRRAAALGAEARAAPLPAPAVLQEGPRGARATSSTGPPAGPADCFRVPATNAGRTRRCTRCCAPVARCSARPTPTRATRHRSSRRRESGYLRLRREAYSDTDLQGWVKRIAAQPWDSGLRLLQARGRRTRPEIRRAVHRAMAGAVKRAKTPRGKVAPKQPAALRDYAAKREFEATPEPAPAPAPERPGPLLFVVQQHAARAPALRLPARGRRRAQVVGGAERAVAESCRQAARGPDRGPSVRLRVVRGRDPGEAVRRGRGDRLGLRRLLARRGPGVFLPRPRRGGAPRPRRPGEGQAQHLSARREAQGLVRAGADLGPQELAAHQAQGPVRRHGRRHGARRVGAVGNAGRGAQAAPGARTHPRGGARSDRADRGVPGEALADARRERRRGFDRPGLEVRAEARRLPGARVRRSRPRRPALAARPRLHRHLPRHRRGARPAAREHDGARRRDRRVRARRPAVLRCAAGPGAAEDRARDRRRRTGDADRLLLLRPPALRRRQPAPGALRGAPPLPRAVPAACRRACSSSTPTTTPGRCTRRRSRAGSKGSWRSGATAPTFPASARRAG